MRQLYASGMSVDEIAAALKLGRTTVYKHLSLRLRQQPRWSEEELQWLIDARYLGMTYKEIAKILGRSPIALRIAMCRHRKWVRSDEKRKAVLGFVSWGVKNKVPVRKLLTAARRADILREVADE